MKKSSNKLKKDSPSTEDHECTGVRTRKQVKEDEREQFISNRTRSRLGSTHVAVSAQAFIASVTIPQTAVEARTLLDKDQWEKSKTVELEVLKKNNTSTLVDPPPNCKPIKSKWIFRIKTNPDGSLDKYKDLLSKDAHCAKVLISIKRFLQ